MTTVTTTTTPVPVKMFENPWSVLFAGLADGYVTAFAASLVVPQFAQQFAISKITSSVGDFFSVFMAGFLGYVGAKIIKRIIPPYGKSYIKSDGGQSILVFVSMVIQAIVNALIVFGVLGTGIFGGIDFAQQAGLGLAGFIGLWVADWLRSTIITAEVAEAEDAE